MYLFIFLTFKLLYMFISLFILLLYYYLLIIIKIMKRKRDNRNDCDCLDDNIKEERGDSSIIQDDLTLIKCYHHFNHIYHEIDLKIRSEYEVKFSELVTRVNNMINHKNDELRKCHIVINEYKKKEEQHDKNKKKNNNSNNNRSDIVPVCIVKDGIIKPMKEYEEEKSKENRKYHDEFQFNIESFHLDTKQTNMKKKWIKSQKKSNEFD